MKVLSARLAPVVALAAILVGLSFLTRLALWMHADTAVPPVPTSLIHILGVGLGFDLAAVAYFCAPLALYLAVLPQRIAGSRPHMALFFAVFGVLVYVLCLVALAEWVFWDEFGTRFNFIAVDYLVYTHEVLGNIWQSYPVGRLLAALLVPTISIVWLARKPVLRGLRAATTWRARLTLGGLGVVLPAAVFALMSTTQKELSENVQANELAGNGLYEFFAANWNNELDYERFYATLPTQEAFAQVRTLMGEPTAQEVGDTPETLKRIVAPQGVEKRLNVVLVSIESLGSEFISVLGNQQGITPQLDALTRSSLFFSNVYATGNRTVRGLEALSLAIPPTPGQSILKRPKNEELFSLGSVFEEKGYDTRFVYGGYGYFDNMGYFFDHNDYTTVDRSALSKADIHYENIWGVADEDLFTLALREADKSVAAGKPFFLHVMTTSNHRPYTYPENRIDIPSGTGREGAVKYTDWAVGDFISRARARPWFTETLFVITADHGASARGTTDIPVERYRIPLWMYAPRHVAPARVDRLMSQIDIAPTLLGLLNMGYESKFFGYDMLRLPPGDERAFVATYQTLGYIRGPWLVTLSPQRKVKVRALHGDAQPSAEQAQALEHEAISLYQVAARAFRHGMYLEEEHLRPAGGSKVTRQASAVSPTSAGRP